MPCLIFILKYPIQLFLFNQEGKNVSEYLVLRNCWQNIMWNDKYNVTLKKVQPQYSPGLSENDGKIIWRGISMIDILTEELPAIRAKIGVTQEELSDILGIRRQTVL